MVLGVNVMLHFSFVSCSFRFSLAAFSEFSLFSFVLLISDKFLGNFLEEKTFLKKT